MSIAPAAWSAPAKRCGSRKLLSTTTSSPRRKAFGVEIGDDALRILEIDRELRRPERDMDRHVRRGDGIDDVGGGPPGLDRDEAEVAEPLDAGDGKRDGEGNEKGVAGQEETPGADAGGPACRDEEHGQRRGRELRGPDERRRHGETGGEEERQRDEMEDEKGAAVRRPTDDGQGDDGGDREGAGEPGDAVGEDEKEGVADGADRIVLGAPFSGVCAAAASTCVAVGA